MPRQYLASERLGTRRAPGATGRRARPRPRIGEHGQGLLELSFLLPLFLLLIVGVVEVASALNTHITVVNAARDGARLASKGGATDQQIEDLVVAETDRLRPSINGPADVTVDGVTLNGSDAVRVEVCAQHKLVLGVRLVMPDSYRMCSSTVMRVAEGGS